MSKSSFLLFPDNKFRNMKWIDFIKEQKQLPYFKQLEEFIAEQRKTSEVYPRAEDVYNAFKYTPFDRVKVVIIGQDPYHTPGAAHGLSFSTLQATRPPSLTNIFKEVKNDYFASTLKMEAYKDTSFFKSNNLKYWADQGVFLLNTILTVRKGEAGSHKEQGWEKFTAEAIKRLNIGENKLVFMLWGSFAHQYESFIDKKRHLILKAAHPSPFSADKGFFGCKHFTQANKFIEKAQHTWHQGVPINWGIWE